MGLLKKENWFVCLLLNVITEGLFMLIPAYYLGCMKKDAWYRKWQYWFFGGVCLIFPAIIMFFIFLIQMTISVAEKLEVPGKEVYASPYVWILCIIIPVIGWALFLVLWIYIEVWPVVKLYQGAGEKYVE